MSTKLVMDQGLYRLDHVDETLEKSPGTWSVAKEKHFHLIEDWYYLFAEEAGVPIPSTNAIKENVARLIDKREVFLWEDDGEVVSMMKKSRPTKRGITVGLVSHQKINVEKDMHGRW